MERLLPLKVLLIEDSHSDVVLLKTALEADPVSRFALTHVERLANGLKQLEEGTFDIVLADLGLPDSSGLDTFERLHRQAPDMPVIVFSGNEDEEQAIRAVRDGAQDYLVKNINGFDMAARSIRYAIERNKLQSTLRESERRFTTLFRMNPVPVGITHASDFRIMDVNDAWTSLTGYTREEALGKTSTELSLVSPETLQEVRIKLGVQGAIQQYDIPLHTRAGEERRVLISSERIELGGEVYFFNSLLDITERKQAEEALAKSEERHRLISGLASDYVYKGILHADGSVKTSWISGAFEHITGYTLDEINKIQHGFASLVLTEDMQRVVAQQPQFIQQHFQTVEYRIRKKDGTIRWLRDYNQISSIDPATNDLEIIGAVQDITERKQADDKLHENEEFLRLAYEAADLGIWKNDLRTGAVEFDERARLHYGFETSTTIMDELIKRVHPEDVERLGAEIAAATSPSSSGKFATEYRVIHPDGSVHWLDIRVQVLFEGGGSERHSVVGYGTTLDITERKLAEEALKESEERFSKAFFTSPLSQSIISTQTGEVVEVNDACCHLYEYSREELIGIDPGKLNLWANPADEASVLEELQRTGHLLPREITIRVKSGEIRTIIFSTEPITWNRILCLISSSTDITERKRAENRLRDSEKKYRELINGMNDTVWVIDFDTTILDVNETASAVLGYTREELLSMKVSDIDLSMKPEQIQHLASAMPVDKSQIFEGVHSTRDGRQIPVEVSSTLVTYQGRTVIMSIARDITERKQAEEAVRASEERLRKILQTTSDGFWLVDSNRRFLDVNEAYCAMSGYARDELLSMTIPDVEALGAVSNTNDHNHRIMNKGRDLFESRHRRKDGTLFDVEVSVNMLGQGTGLMVCLCRDITERKKVAQTLQESQERYKQFINQSFEAISRTEFDQPVDTSLPVEEQIDQIYANAYMAECNQAMAEMYKTPLEQFIGTRLIDAHGGKDNPTNRAAFRKFILNGYKSIDDETIEYDAQGIQHWFLSNTIGTVEDGKLIRLWGTAIEVTDRKKAEAALRESNERFQQIAATIQEVFWMYDNREQRLLYVSPGLENLWGRPVPTLDEVNRLTMESIYPEDRSLYLELLANQQQGQPTDGEYRIVHADGKVRWVHSRSFPLLDENGTLVRTTGIITDVTSRKQAVQDALYRQELLEKVILLGKKIAAITDLESCLREIYESARFELGFDRIGLFLYDGSVRHVTGVYGTTRTGEMEYPGFLEGPIDEFEDWTTALQSPAGISWHDHFERDLTLAEDHVMYGVKQHLTVAAWAGEKPVALITADNLLTGREITAPDIEALQLFAGYVGLAIENASLHGELELKVEERTAEVQDLYDNAPTGYHSLDTNGYFIQINQTELSWLGYTREEVIGHLIGEFITENSRAIFQQNFSRFKKEGRLRDLELEMVRKDGSVFPVLINATAILDGHGNFIMSRTTVFDHSERKTAEQALRDSQANLQNFLDTASDMIQSLDERGNFIYVNDAWCEAVGFTQQEAVQLTMFDVIDPAYHEHCRATLRELVTSGHPQQLEIIFRTKRGETIVAEGSVSGRTVKGGELVTNGIFRNITKRKQAEASLQRANLELERALRMKDEFLASMSHELRTPLTGILGLSEALQYDTYGELNPKQKNILANIENNGRHLLDLINDILDISKMEAGKLELEMYPCALSEICQSSLQLVKGMAQKKGQQVAFSMNPTDILVKGDPRRLKQILVNLLSNAVKYSPGNSSIGLDVQADSTNHVVTLEVWDNGMGIPQEDLDRLFQPFVQLDSSLSRQQTGTGLGLALVQKLVDLHGGSIQVESAPGMGSRFIVKLPSLSSTLESKQEPEELLPQIHNVLIVEDSATDSGRLTRSLKMLGIYSTVLTTGTGVPEEAARLQPGVILLDLDLPEVSGWEVLEHLKHNALTRDIPVVITSVVDERERAAQLGAAGYLVKFFTLDELRYTLSHLPQAGRTRQEKTMDTSPATHFGTIMIVDDNETNIMMIADFLLSKNYNVVTSLSGTDFLKRIPDIQPDLVLMDIQMPDMDGLETVRRLRLLPEPRLARVPVIAITALAMPGDRERCLEAGANEYISKPVRLKELVSLIQAMMISRVDFNE